jgi:hypothetical protein
MRDETGLAGQGGRVGGHSCIRGHGAAEGGRGLDQGGGSPDGTQLIGDVRYTPESGHLRDTTETRFYA